MPFARSSASNGRNCTCVRKSTAKSAGRASSRREQVADLGHDLLGLGRLVLREHDAHGLAGAARRAQRLSWRFGLWRITRVGGVQDRLRRAVVRLEPHDAWRPGSRARSRGSSGRRRRASRRSTGRRRPRRTGCAWRAADRAHDLVLGAVRVLVLVDQHVAVAPAVVLAHRARARAAGARSRAAGRRSRARACARAPRW